MNLKYKSLGNSIIISKSTFEHLVKVIKSQRKRIEYLEQKVNNKNK